MKYNKALLISFILIVVISVAGHFFFFENDSHIKYDGYGISFLYMAIVGLIGYAAWRKYPLGWPSRIWGIVYVSVFCTIACFILANKFIFHLSAKSIVGVHHARDVFNTPMPFLILYVVVKYVAKATPVQADSQP